MDKYGQYGQKLDNQYWWNWNTINKLGQNEIPFGIPIPFTTTRSELQKRHLVFKIVMKCNQNWTLPFRIHISLNITPFGQKTRSTLQITFTNGKLQILVRNTLIQIRFWYENCQRSFLDFGFKIQSKGRGHIRHSFDF